MTGSIADHDARPEPRPLTFFHSGGSVMWRGRYALTDADIQALADLYFDERCAARKAIDGKAFINATRLHDELLDALFKAREWKRASGCIRDLSTNTEQSHGL